MTSHHEAEGRPPVDEEEPNLSDLAEGKDFIVMDDGSKITPAFYRRALSFKGERDWFGAAKTLEAHDGQNTDLNSYKLLSSCKNQHVKIMNGRFFRRSYTDSLILHRW
jgi:hypothetical protein